MKCDGNLHGPKLKTLLLKNISQNNLELKPALTKFGRCEQYIIDSINGILFDGILTGKRGWSIAWKRGGMDNRPSISPVSRRGHRSWISDENWKLNRWNAKEEYANILLDKCYLLYEEYPKEKENICLYPETLPRNRPKLRRKSKW